MEYRKPYLTFEEQADLIIQRGMICQRESLVRHLKDVGYYRLSGYWYIFKNSDDSFKEGTNFSQIWELYVLL